MIHEPYREYTGKCKKTGKLVSGHYLVKLNLNQHFIWNFTHTIRGNNYIEVFGDSVKEKNGN